MLLMFRYGFLIAYAIVVHARAKMPFMFFAVVLAATTRLDRKPKCRRRHRSRNIICG